MEHRRNRTSFAAYFFRQFRRETAVATGLILAANVLEGISALALFPALTLIFGDQEVSSGNSFVRGIFDNIFALVGLELTLANLLLLIAAGMLLKGIVRFFAMRRAGHIAVRLANRLRRRLIGALFEARWSYFIEQPTGEFATALGVESNATVIAFTQLCHFIASSGLAIVYLIVLLLVSWQGLLLALAGIAISTIVFAPLIAFSRQMGQRTAMLQKSLVRDLIDTVPGLRSIRAMNLQGCFEPWLRNSTAELQLAEEKGITAQTVMPSFFEPVLTLVIVVGYLIGSQLLDFSIPELTIIAFSLWRAGWQMHLAQFAYRYTAANEPFFWSLLKLINAAEQAEEVHRGTLAAPAGPITLQLDRLCFAYDELAVLSDLSMTIPAERITVISGLSGAGKSTLIDLILAFRHPSAGRILVNGKDLASLSLGSWRSLVGYVPQKTTLFHNTIFQNIILGDTEIEAAQVRAALEAARAWDFVSSMPQGMDTVCGEGGSKVSGGQAQRLAIARALVRRPRLLILDEATTGLDPSTEAAVIESLGNLRGSMTILTVSHQRAIRRIADVSYHLENGQVSRQALKS